MIGSSKLEFLFIRTCILGLHYLAPLCILYVVAVVAIYGLRATRYPVPLLIEAVALAETAFYFLVYLPYSFYLQRAALHPPPPSRAERQELFELCNRNIPDPEEYLRKWFLGAELDDIKRENLKEFFFWAFFNRGGEPGEDEEELEGYVVATEELLGKKIEEGRGSAMALRTTLDTVNMLHRSLTWYFCVAFVDFLTYIRLLALGFYFHRTPLSQFLTLFPFRPLTLLSRYRSPVKHLSYWHRPHTSKTKLPVLFIHGIGIGLYPYTNFLGDLNAKSPEGLESDDPDDQVGIIAIELMPVSFRITHPALAKDQMCTEIAAILALHGYSKVVLVSHSFGTVVSTHLLQHPSTKDCVGPMVLIDPVSILLHLPDVAYNFCRRQPEKANEHQLYYFASMDMAVSHTLGRHFFWNENVLWKKDLVGRDVTVSLGERDLIVNTEAVGKYMSCNSGAEDGGSLVEAQPVAERSNSAASTSSHVLVNISSPESGDEEEKPNGQANINVNGKAVIEMTREIEYTDETGGLLDSIEEKDAWKRQPWKGKGIDVIWFDGLDHAQAFDKAATRRPLVRAIRTYCKKGSLEMVGVDANL